MKCSLALAVAVLCTAVPAQAAQTDLTSTSDGFTYYNRPGANWATHSDDLQDCLAKGSLTEADDATGASGIIPGMVGGQSQKRSVLVAAENCMVVRGWRVVRVPDIEGEALAALPSAQLAERLRPWIGAEAPKGDIVRQWGNEAINGGTKRAAYRPNWFGKPSLSLLAIVGSSTDRGLSSPPKPRKGVRGRKVKSFWLKDLGEVPADSALVFVRLVNPTLSEQVYSIRRMGQIDGEPAWVVDPSSNAFLATSGVSGRDGGYITWIVPAGVWRIASLGAISSRLDFCLGSPQFEVKAGDVLNLGTFSIRSESLAPDMSSDDLKAVLVDKPDLVQRLKPATYVNGSTDQCGGTFIYALEFPGAGFVEGYTWGSEANQMSAPVDVTKP